jgi:hypothetical protein
VDIKVISAELHREPFRPFTLRLADGGALAVPHRDFVAVSPRRVVVIDANDDSMSIIEPLLIVSIEYGAERAPSANGPGASG